MDVMEMERIVLWETKLPILNFTLKLVALPLVLLIIHFYIIILSLFLFLFLK